jgi:hypothetical protein
VVGGSYGYHITYKEKYKIQEGFFYKYHHADDDHCSFNNNYRQYKEKCTEVDRSGL